MFRTVVATACALMSIAITSDLAAQEYVVIDSGAPIFRSPSTKSARLVIGDQRFITLEKLATKKGWVQVKVNGPLDWKDHCATTAYELNGIELDMWVREKALVDVTAQTVSSKFPDATSVEFAPGVRLSPRPDKGWYTAHVAGYEWPVQLSDQQVGTSFRPQPLPQPEGDYRSARRDVEVAGETIATTNQKSFRVVRTVESQGQTRYQISARCMSARVAGDFAPPASGRLLGALGGDFGLGKNLMVSEGATVYWLDGVAAGKARRETIIEPSGKTDGRICTKFPLHVKSALELCFDVDDTKELEIFTGLAGVLGDDDGDFQAALSGGAKIDTKRGPDVTPKTGISKNVVKRVVEHRRARLDRCFSDHMANKPGLSATIDVELWVDEDGKVDRSEVADSALDDDVQDCVLNVVDALLFPAKKGRKRSKTTYSIQFGSR